MPVARRRQLAALFACILPLACPAAQDAPGSATLPRFEVATVKAIEPNTPHMMGIRVYPGGRLEIAGFALKTLIGAAFDLSFWQISGGEEWVSKDEYFVVAKPPENARPAIRSLRHTLFGIDDPVLRQMLQALLIDRFQLRVHRDSKTGDVYLLTRNLKPLAMHIAEVAQGAPEKTAFGSIGYVDGKWGIFATTMPQLAKFASGIILHAPVSDRTSLDGAFEYRQPQPDLEPRYGGDQSDSFKAFLAQAGLKLEHTRGAVETLIIDQATRPSAN